jgi:peptidoglycan/xylan/chitin deacetylase (PgdA/CDA1 family)
LGLAFTAAAVLLAVPSVGTPDSPRPKKPRLAASVAWPLQLTVARFRQQGPDVQLDVITSGNLSAAALTAKPGRLLCIDLLRGSHGLAVRQICLTAIAGKARFVRQELRDNGSVKSSQPIGATVTRPSNRRVIASFSTESVGLGLGAYRWQVHSQWTDTSACSSFPCSSYLPQNPKRATIVKPVRIGCRATGTSLRSNGSRAHRVVAISFDDGPSQYTAAILRSLKRHHAHATFFEVGNQMGGKSALQRRILAEGNSIGDHSWSHPVLSGGGPFAAREVSDTKARIIRQTGFTPCLFRAPYGAVSGNLIGLVRQRGMLTIQWDVDPTDWARPGTGAIISRVLAQVRRGSIILMHDAGGDRSQSVAAAETILATLERRGIRVVSVETLLGLESIYK